MAALGSKQTRVAEHTADAKASPMAMTPEEDAAITAAARLDPDNPPLHDDEPFDVDGELKSIIWLDADVVTRLKAEGAGWQVRANRILREALGV